MFGIAESCLRELGVSPNTESVVPDVEQERVTVQPVEKGDNLTSSLMILPQPLDLLFQGEFGGG